MLETIREFATERLGADPAFAEAARDAHAGYFADLAADAWAAATAGRGDEPLGPAITDLENLRIAWRHAMERADRRRLAQLADPLWNIFERRGWYHGTIGLIHDELAILAADPLVTIGAHTVNHVMLRKATDDAVRREMQLSASTIEAALGKRPAHFSYPVGDRTSAGPREFRIAAEVGFKTAVTTRPGVLFPEHAGHLTALPRISLNGEYQQRRYAKVLLSGAATALWNGFRRVDAA